MKSRIDELVTSVEELKNTPKAVIAFRPTCAKNFPSEYKSHSENPGWNIAPFYKDELISVLLKTTLTICFWLE